VGHLGRRVPVDWDHVNRFPLTLANAPLTPVPVVLGVNWYSLFDDPKKIHGDWWIDAKDANANLGQIRGGHAICCEPGTPRDTSGWWTIYDQKATSACTGYSGSRMMSILNRKTYDPLWLYHEAQKRDGFKHQGDDGSTVRAACDVLRLEGEETPGGKPSRAGGISANRWATNAHQVSAALANPAGDKREAVVLLNSWGPEGYPHRVYLHLSVVDRLLSEDGEACLVTDR
jgi:hypothetical protein